jgi:hypothetical protein
MNYLAQLLTEFNHIYVGQKIGQIFKDHCENLGLETMVGYPREYHNKYLEEFINGIREGFLKN